MGVRLPPQNFVHVAPACRARQLYIAGEQIIDAARLLVGGVKTDSSEVFIGKVDDLGIKLATFDRLNRGI